MPLSPDDIERRQFVPALRGYDRDQVDAFLTEVAEDHRTLLRRLQLLSERAEGATDEADDRLFGIGEQVERLLRTAVESAKEIRSAGEDEVVQLRENAQRELQAAQQAMAKAADESKVLAAEAADLAEQRQEAQRALQEAAQLREAAERDAAELRGAAEREAAELRDAAEREATELRDAADREAAELRGTAGRACQEAANLLEAAEQARRTALNLRAERDDDVAVDPVTDQGSLDQPTPGSDADRGQQSDPPSPIPGFPSQMIDHRVAEEEPGSSHS